MFSLGSVSMPASPVLGGRRTMAPGSRPTPVLPAVPTSRGRTGVGVLLRGPLKMPPTGCWKTCGITGMTTGGTGVGGTGVLGTGVFGMGVGATGQRARLAGIVLGMPLTAATAGSDIAFGGVKADVWVAVIPPIVPVVAVHCCAIGVVIVRSSVALPLGPIVQTTGAPD